MCAAAEPRQSVGRPPFSRASPQPARGWCRHVSTCLLLLLLLVGSAAAAAAAAPPPPAAPASRTPRAAAAPAVSRSSSSSSSSSRLQGEPGATCSFTVIGDGHGGVASADMVCSGGPAPRLIVTEHLLGRHVDGWTGVEVAAEGCKIRPCPCMLLISGASVSFVDSLVANVTAEELDTEGAQLPLALICITASKVSFRNTTLQGNGAQGISVRGGSSVTMDGCRVMDGVQGGNDIKGGALSSSDDNTLVLRGTNITGNNCLMGCGVTMNSGTLNISRCVLSGNNAFQQGGALMLTRYANVSIADSTIFNNTALTDAGGISVDEASLYLQRVNLTHNVANRSGGGVHVLYGNLTGQHVLAAHNRADRGGGLLCNFGVTLVKLTDSLFDSNTATQFAGGLMADGDCQLTLAGTRVTRNKAGVYRVGTGGGLHVNGAATLRLLHGTVVAANSATRYGGGIRLMSEGFVDAEVQAAAVGRHNRAKYAGAEDVSLAPYDMTLQNASRAQFIPGQGCSLHLQVLVQGPKGKASVGEDIEASVLGVKEAMVTEPSNAQGVSNLFVRLYQRPGTYRLHFKALSNDSIPPQNMTVDVLDCPPGFVQQMQQNDWTCLMCGDGTYSLDSNATTCTQCSPDSSECIGATLWPKEGYWHSSSASPQFIRCLNPSACKGGGQPPGPWRAVRAAAQQDADAPTKAGFCDLFTQQEQQQQQSGGRHLLQEQQLSEQQYKDSQCAEGYRGNLCGSCLPGWSKVRAHACKPCQPTATILALYILAALSMLGVIKLVLVFNTRDCQDPLTSLFPIGSAGIAPTASGGIAAPGAAAASPAVPGKPPLVGHAIELAMMADQARSLGSSGGGGSQTPFATAAAAAGLSRYDSSSGGGSLPGTHGTAAVTASRRSGSGVGGLKRFLRLPKRLRSASSSWGGSSSKSQQLKEMSPTDIAKPFILYAQYLCISASMAGIPWPDTLTWPIKALEWFWSTASSHALSIDCLMQHSSSAVPLAVRKTLVDLFVPVLLLLVLLALEAGLAYVRKCRARYGWQVQVLPTGQVMRVCIVVTFFFLPFLIRTVLGMFACKALDDGPPGPGERLAAVGSYWLSDMDQACGQGYHKAWALGLGMPLALALCVAWPGFIAGYTWRHRARLSEPHFRRHYSFLTRSYKPRYCFWEAVVVLETVMLCATAAYAAMLGVYWQSLLMIAAFALMFVVLLLVQPHAHPIVSRVTLQSYGVLFVTSYMVLTFLPFEGGPSPPRAYGMVIGVVVLLVNLAHILYCLVLLLRTIDWKQAKATTMLAVSSVLKPLRSGSVAGSSRLRSTSSGGVGGSRQGE